VPDDRVRAHRVDARDGLAAVWQATIFNAVAAAVAVSGAVARKWDRGD
jgi:hypothetical protein